MLSVVIPTLGGPSLSDTIKYLNSGSVVPDEIIICIPESYASCISEYSVKNVKVLVTQKMGQVYQRSEGFKNALYERVLQLDDDIHVDKQCIKILLDSMSSLDTNSAIAPSFMNIKTGKSVYASSFSQGILSKIYYWLSNGVDGYQPGSVDKACTSIGVNPSIENSEMIKVGWLAGGCILHNKKLLVLDDFYPFSGKAFNEDIIHSQLLSDKGVQLWVNTKATCRLEIIPSTNYNMSDFLNNFIADYKSRKYFAKISGRSVLRMHVFYTAWFISYISTYVKGFVISLNKKKLK